MTTTNTQEMARTAREITEAQHDVYRALTENLAATQRRSIGLADYGREFMRLQDDNTRAAQEWFANGVRLLQLQQRNARRVQSWTSDILEAMREQTGHNARTAEAFARSAIKQQEGLQALTQVWSGAYWDFFSPFAYTQKSVRTVQRATRQGSQAIQQGLRVAEEATEQTEEVLRQTRELEGLSTEQFKKVLAIQAAANAELKRQAEALRPSRYE